MICPYCHKHFEIDRTDWPSIFDGKTLTEKITELHVKGKTKHEALFEILSELREKNMLYPDIAKKVRIGVQARYGEMATKKRIIKQEQRLLNG